MSAPMPCTDCTSISNFSGTGFGTEAKELKKQYSQAVYEFRNTETLGRPNTVLQSLDKVFEECSAEGWDGYEAIPITEGAYIEAEKLIKSLPLTSFPMPEITPEPNGDIGLEWYREARMVFVASVSGENEIVYAGLFGTDKTNGKTHFSDSLPSAITTNLRTLYED